MFSTECTVLHHGEWFHSVLTRGQHCVTLQYTHKHSHTHAYTLVLDDIHRRTQESPPPSLIGRWLPTERFYPSVPIRWSSPFPSHENHENNRASQARWAPAHRQQQTPESVCQEPRLIQDQSVPVLSIYFSARKSYLGLKWGSKSWTLTWVIEVPFIRLPFILLSVQL